MITEENLIEYFEPLAIDSKAINHTLNDGKSFFFIDNPDDLDEFDQALRASATSPAMLLVADDGEFDDNDSNNYTQELSGSFYIIAKTRSDFSSKQAKAMCLPIVLDFLVRMRSDSTKGLILGDKQLRFRIKNVPYKNVGPMDNDWYGYAVWFTFYCPLTFSVTSASWRSIP